MSSGAERPEQNARRLIRMVHEAHKRGYQLLRIMPGLSPSGMHWRCSIFPAQSASGTHGAMVAHDQPQARYTTADGRRYFGWRDAADVGPRTLCAMFLARYPEIADRAHGRDYEYAGWFVELLGHVDSSIFPISFDDWYFERPNPSRNQVWLPTSAGWSSGLPMPPLVAVRKGCGHYEAVRTA